MEGFWESASRWFNEKTSSPLYFTYVTFFIVWNWKFFQVVFLEDATLFNTPRIEYIESNLDFYFVLPWVWQWISEACVILVNILWHVLPPVLFSYFSIKYLPLVHKWAFGIYVNNHFARKSVYRTANLEYEKGKTSNLQKVADEKQKQVKQRNIIEKSQTQEERWLEDYESFKRSNIFQKFQQLINVVYTNGGRTGEYVGSSFRRNIDTDILAYVHAKGLIDLSGQGSKEIVEFSEKGKYFVDKYLSERP